MRPLCPTKIFLANKDAASDDHAELYQSLGCNSAEIQIISDMIPKRQYFVRGEGRRRIEFSLAPIALAFCGASSKEDLAMIRALQQKYGSAWVDVWLEERGVPREYLQKISVDSGSNNGELHANDSDTNSSRWADRRRTRDYSAS